MPANSANNTKFISKGLKSLLVFVRHLLTIVHTTIRHKQAICILEIRLIIIILDRGRPKLYIYIDYKTKICFWDLEKYIIPTYVRRFSAILFYRFLII